ncbi:MAG: hypothetical protein ACREE9_22835 [Stellaceae bacterium]
MTDTPLARRRALRRTHPDAAALSDDLRQITSNVSPSDEAEEQAQQSMFRDIDAILARLESGIEAERTAVDALLDRLTTNAA